MSLINFNIQDNDVCFTFDQSFRNQISHGKLSRPSSSSLSTPQFHFHQICTPIYIPLLATQQRISSHHERALLKVNVLDQVIFAEFFTFLDNSSQAH